MSMIVEVDPMHRSSMQWDLARDTLAVTGSGVVVTVHKGAVPIRNIFSVTPEGEQYVECVFETVHGNAVAFIKPGRLVRPRFTSVRGLLPQHAQQQASM
jgi:hypothetical protein